MTIEDFLLARISEDEAAATAAGNLQFWLYEDYPLVRHLENNGERILTVDPVGIAGNYWNHAARHLPGRVLAECAAKRAIVERYVYNLDLARSYRKLPPATPWAVRWTEHRLQEARLATSLEACVALVAVYADHPDYQQDWTD